MQVESRRDSATWGDLLAWKVLFDSFGNELFGRDVADLTSEFDFVAGDLTFVADDQIDLIELQLLIERD